MECDWNNPGVNKYTGSAETAIYSYDFPKSVSEELLYKIRRSNLDAVVTITRDDIIGAFGKPSNLSSMHFGKSRCTGVVKRDKWDVSRKELATVYCDDSYQYCIAIPKICGNISRIDYTPFRKSEPPIRFYDPPNQVPEPSTMLLVIMALAISIFYEKRNTSNSTTV